MDKQQKELLFLFQNLLGNKGISILEIVIVIGIFSVIFFLIFTLSNFSLNTNLLIKKTLTANHLACEAIEALRNLRDGTDWQTNGIGTFLPDIEYHLEATSSPQKWQLVEGEETIGSFKRKVIFKNVFRDLNSNIVETGGAQDPDTRKIIVSVSWNEKGQDYKVELITFLTNWRK